jgi:hypothetical protein
LNTHNSTSSACATSQSRAHGERPLNRARTWASSGGERHEHRGELRSREAGICGHAGNGPTESQICGHGRRASRRKGAPAGKKGGRQREKSHRREGGPAAGEESRGGGGREERTCVSRVERGSAAGDRAYLLVTPRAGGEGGGGTGRSPRDDDPRLLPLALSSLSLSLSLSRTERDRVQQPNGAR